MKTEAMKWTKLWRAIYQLQCRGVDGRTMDEVSRQLRRMDEVACDGYHELDDGEAPEHIWYAALYDDGSVRIQVRSGPSIAFDTLDRALEYYPELVWLRGRATRPVTQQHKTVV